MGTRSVVPVPVQVNIERHSIGNEDRAFAVPPSINIGNGATKVPSVQWKNETSKDAKFWFPNGAALFSPPKDGFENPLRIRAGDVLTLYVNDDPKEGQYHYHVYCEATEDCAHGYSEPTATCP